MSVRDWTCPYCGAHHDRDVNAAINIREEGLKLLPQAIAARQAELQEFINKRTQSTGA